MEPEGPAPGRRPVIPGFKTVLVIVTALTVLSLMTSVALSLWGRENEATERLIETCATTWKMGFAAIIGLIGGRTLS
jgi:hypothetical protein